jgi:hypothetical protein
MISPTFTCAAYAACALLPRPPCPPPTCGASSHAARAARIRHDPAASAAHAKQPGVSHREAQGFDRTGWAQGPCGRARQARRAAQAGGRWRPHRPIEDLSLSKSCERGQMERLVPPSARQGQKSGPSPPATCDMLCAAGRGGRGKGRRRTALRRLPFAYGRPT